LQQVVCYSWWSFHNSTNVLRAYVWTSPSKCLHTFTGTCTVSNTVSRRYL